MKNIKLNESVYTRMLVQVEEAKELGFERLAFNVSQAIAAEEDVEFQNEYSRENLETTVQHKLWSIAMDFIKYHDLKNVDIQKIDDSISHLIKIVSHEMEHSLDSNDKIGPLEPALPGESK